MTILKEYFEHAEGIGILATADQSGVVDVAVYGRPHVIDEQTVAFIAGERLTHSNLEQNPHAAYLFKEAGDRYVGKRLYLTKIREEKDSPQIAEIRRKHYPAEAERKVLGSKYLILFRVDRVRPLVGDAP